MCTHFSFIEKWNELISHLQYPDSLSFSNVPLPDLQYSPYPLPATFKAGAGYRYSPWKNTLIPKGATWTNGWHLASTIASGALEFWRHHLELFPPWNEQRVFFPENLGDGNWNIFKNHLYLEKIPILTKIFQIGWNHQLEIDGWKTILSFWILLGSAIFRGCVSFRKIHLLFGIFPERLHVANISIFL